MGSSKDLTWSSVYGHENSIEELRSMLTQKRMPHSLLFTGPAGVGKASVARRLGAALLCRSPRNGEACGQCDCCRSFLAGSHPDYFYIQPETSGKSTTSSIKVEAIKEMQSSIARIPLQADSRVVIINDADKMNNVVANGLLKTIEEPIGQVVFILITSVPAALLDTIKSRCMRIEFGMLPKAAISQYLMAQGIAAEAANSLAALSDGSIGRALELNNPELMELREKAKLLFDSIGTIELQEIWKQGEALSKLSRNDISQLLSYFSMLLRDLLVMYNSPPAGGISSVSLYNEDRLNSLTAAAGRFSEGQLLELLRLTAETQHRLISSNANVRLLLESLLIRLKDIEYIHRFI